MVSYCMVVAFHPDLKIPRLMIFRSYYQNQNALTLLSHFQALEFNFFEDPGNFNTTTLKQLRKLLLFRFRTEKKYSFS